MKSKRKFVQQEVKQKQKMSFLDRLDIFLTRLINNTVDEFKKELELAYKKQLDDFDEQMSNEMMQTYYEFIKDVEDIIKQHNLEGVIKLSKQSKHK